MTEQPMNELLTQLIILALGLHGLMYGFAYMFGKARAKKLLQLEIRAIRGTIGALLEGIGRVFIKLGQAVRGKKKKASGHGHP
jgi:hypothetical protein